MEGAGDGEEGAEPAGLPDFDCYPIRFRIVASRADSRKVHVTWDDGLKSTHHVFWLRENAPDADTTHPVTREQVLQLVDIPEDLVAVNAVPSADGGLSVHWSTGEESRYHPGWLRAHTPGSDTIQDILPARRIWSKAADVVVPYFDGPSVLADDMLLAEWAEALHVDGAAVLENLPATAEVIETVPARLGPIRPTNFGPVFDVKSKPDADSNAYTTMTLPVHVDLPTREYMPGLQFLHCIQNDADGGDSVLVDGFALAERIREADAEAFETLTTVPLSYINKAKVTDYRRDEPLIRLDEDGNYLEVRWAPWLRGPLRASWEVMDRVYHALRLAFALAEDPDLEVRLRLKAGDLLGFDNRRMLHGRTGFDPTTGGRWLRGCYLERDEIFSRIRILARERRRAGLE